MLTGPDGIAAGAPEIMPSGRTGLKCAVTLEFHPIRTRKKQSERAQVNPKKRKRPA